MNEDTCKRENTPEAIASRELIRDRFVKSSVEDSMVLLIEEWDSPDFPGVDFYAQYSPILMEDGEGRPFLDHRFLLLGKGPSGRLPSDGIRIPGDPEAALRAGESLVAYAFRHEVARMEIRNACPDLVAKFERLLLDLNSSPGEGSRKFKI